MKKLNLISAKVIEHNSLHDDSKEIYSVEVVLPRYILAELNTHRVFSRNSASSRAIPAQTMIDLVKTMPFIPLAWQIEHKGMQGQVYITDEREIHWVDQQWLLASQEAVSKAEYMTNNLKVSKQFVNRILEPYMWHKVLITSTEWENFFNLRCPRYEINCGPDDTDNSTLCVGKSWKELMGSNFGLAKDFDTEDITERLGWNKGAADIHMSLLAEAIYDAINISVPNHRYEFNGMYWHLPYTTQKEKESLDLQSLIYLSVARCARTSYSSIQSEKQFTFEQDIDLSKRLYKMQHLSPFEHVAQFSDSNINNSVVSNNFVGFFQLRQLLEIDSSLANLFN